MENLAIQPGEPALAASCLQNLLITCGGKWVGIVIQLREAMRRNPLLAEGKIVVASSDELTPAGCFADQAVQVPPIRDPGYVDRLIEVCLQHRIRVVVPLIDLDLERLSPHLARFGEIGTTVVCPQPKLVDLCFDKLAFAQFAAHNGLRHPQTVSPPDLAGLRFPVFYKRRRGFGSIGSGICQSPEEAIRLSAAAPDLVFQELVNAPEITVDAYIARSGRCVVRVSRVRDKVVAGESYKSYTVCLPAVDDLAKRTIEALAREGLRGPLNVQIFHTTEPVLLEVNTRLGSAVVLSNVATGGRLFDTLLHEALGGTSEGDPSDYRVGLHLNRFLGDVFHTGTEVVAVKPQ